MWRSAPRQSNFILFFHSHLTHFTDKKVGSVRHFPEGEGEEAEGEGACGGEEGEGFRALQMLLSPLVEHFFVFSAH